MDVEKQAAKGQGAPARLRPLQCRRLGRRLALSQHERCLYCFGSRKDLLTRDHARFCDFRPGIDPISFGFPRGFSRT